MYRKYEIGLTAHIAKAKMDHYRRIIRQNSSCRSIWKVVDGFMGKKTEKEQIKAVMRNGELITDEKAMANEFKDLFCSIITINNGLAYPGQEIVSNTMMLDENISTDIIPMLNDIKGGSKDEYGLNKSILKKIIFSIIDPLTILYSRCMTECVFPECLKRATVIPIHKKGDKTNPMNYRPISILPIFGKILEKIIKKQINAFLDDNNIRDHRQHGYRKGKGTETAIQALITSVTHGLDNSSKVATLFLDLTKAFDCVDHEILLYRLHCYGLRGNIYKLLKDYLTNRTQVVVIGQERSEITSIDKGVPQGSVLGPILFVLYIDTIFKTQTRGQIIAYADDICVTWAESDHADLKTKMLEDISVLHSYLTSVKLSVSEKSRVIMFKIKDVESVNSQEETDIAEHIPFEVTTEFNYLGVLIDDRLKWDQHVERLTNKIRSALRAIYTLRHMAPLNVVKSVYIATVQSHLIYGLPVWGSLCSDKLERAVKRVSRVLHVKSMTELYSWRSLHSLCTVDIPRPHISNPRRSTVDKIRVEKCRTAFRTKQFPVAAINIFNTLPVDVRTMYFMDRVAYKRVIREICECE